MAKFEPKTVYVTYIASTPEKVWQALTSSELTRKYFWDRDIEIEPKRGGAFALKLSDGRINVRGKVIAWEPPRVLEYEWNVGPVPEMPRGEHAIFRYELRPVGDSTHVLITYRRITTPTARGFLPGLHLALAVSGAAFLAGVLVTLAWVDRRVDRRVGRGPDGGTG